MVGFLIDFEWYRNTKGFKLVSWKSILGPKDEPRSGDCIVENGGDWIPYRPIQQFDALYLGFANVESANDLLKFYNRFGPLSGQAFVIGESGPESFPPEPEFAWGDDVSWALKKARTFRELLLLASRPKEVARYFESELLAPIRGLKDPPQDNKPLLGFELSFSPRTQFQYEKEDILKLRQRTSVRADLWSSLHVAEIDLIADPNKGIRLRMKTDTLISALWWQLGQALSGNTIVRQCRQCGTLFEVGPGTNKRADATFCSHQHSMLFHSLKRSRGG
jgi:hypothetical protein